MAARFARRQGGRTADVLQGVGGTTPTPHLAIPTNINININAGSMHAMLIKSIRIAYSKCYQ